MLKKMAGCDGFHAQFLRTPKVLDVVRDDEAATGGDRAFEHHVVVGAIGDGPQISLCGTTPRPPTSADFCAMGGRAIRLFPFPVFSKRIVNDDQAHTTRQWRGLAPFYRYRSPTASPPRCWLAASSPGAWSPSFTLGQKGRQDQGRHDGRVNNGRLADYSADGLPKKSSRKRPI